MEISSCSYEEKLKRLQRTLLSSIQQFRAGEDERGLTFLIESIDDLENILDYQQYSGKLQNEIFKVIPCLQEIIKYFANGDIVGITDTLEFKLQPHLLTLLHGGDGGAS